MSVSRKGMPEGARFLWRCFGGDRGAGTRTLSRKKIFDLEKDFPGIFRRIGAEYDAHHHTDTATAGASNFARSGHVLGEAINILVQFEVVTGTTDAITGGDGTLVDQAQQLIQSDLRL